MCLLDNRDVRQGWQSLKDNVATMFSKHGGEIVSARRWQERRLSYPVKHQQRGTYLLVYFNIEPEMITPLRRDLELSDPVMRNLVLTCEQIPEDAHQPEEEFDESQVQVEDVYQMPATATRARAAEAEKEKTEKGAEKSAEKSAESAAEVETDTADAAADAKKETTEGSEAAAVDGEPAGDETKGEETKGDESKTEVKE